MLGSFVVGCFGVWFCGIVLTLHFVVIYFECWFCWLMLLWFGLAFVLLLVVAVWLIVVFVIVLLAISWCLGDCGLFIGCAGSGLGLTLWFLGLFCFCFGLGFGVVACWFCLPVDHVLLCLLIVLRCAYSLCCHVL